MESRGATVEAEYIERFETINKVEAPFGEILEFPTVQFDHFSFSIGTKAPNLELHGAPRSLGTFFNQIAGYLDFELTIEPLEVDLQRWVSTIEPKVQSLAVTNALISNLSLSNSVSAKVALIGTTEVRPFVQKLTGRRSYGFSKMQISGAIKSQRFKCDLFADGRANILTGVAEEISTLLRTSLNEAVQNRMTH